MLFHAARTSAAAMLLTCAVLSFAGAAQSYPVKPVRLVVPFAPGGGTDISARLLADALGKAFGRPVVVDNRPGAGSIIGTNLVAKSSPDGYTLLLGNISMAFNAALYRKLPYDIARDFAPVSLVAEQPNILVAHPSLPARTYGDFVALARSQPGKLTYASNGVGTGGHLAMELLLMRQKIDLVHVPYKGTGQVVTALLGNEISVFFSSFATVLPHVKGERLRAFAVSSVQRAPALAKVPTVAESGVAGYEYSTWYGLLAPARVPEAAAARLNRETVAALGSSEVRERFQTQGMDPRPSTAAHFTAYVGSETRKWSQVVRTARIPQQ